MHAFVVDVEVALVRDDGTYLMTVRGAGEEHAAGLLAFPGGCVEPDILDDVLEATAVREVEEEIGLAIEQLEYVKSHTFSLEDGRLVVVVLFLARYAGGVPRVVDREEVSSVAWMSAAEILSRPDTPPWIREMLARAEDRRVALGW